jgi:chemotaxis protein methyltransferase WspC
VSVHGEVEKLLSDVIGLDPESIGVNSVRNEIDSLMSSLKLDSLDLYMNALRADKKELGRLIERIVVPETWFFRDRESFRYLKHYSRGIAREKGGDPLRILSAPCSTGEEPYSIVMTLLDAGLTPGDFRVQAVDISGRALEWAKRAEYGRTSFRGENQHPNHFFVPLEGRWRLPSLVTDLVDFFQDNILNAGFSSNRGIYHIVFCRNLLIYLNREARQKLFDCINRLLLPGGLLFAGHSELPSFLERGYVPVAHSRSFACIKSPETGLSGLKAPACRKRSRAAKRFKKDEPSAPVVLTQMGKEKKRAHGQSIDARRSSLLVVRQLADRGSLVEASVLCEKYLTENGPDKEGFCLMGLIDQALDRRDQAEDLFMKALYLDPFYYEALIHMALLSEQKGDETKAGVYRERIKRLEDGPTASGRGA